MTDANKPKIFIVEDDRNNHPLFKDAYELAGFEVMLRYSADDPFIEKVVEYAPDVISLDLMIGREGFDTDRDGFDALALLKADERTRDIPVIIVSNFSNEERVERAQDLGAVDYYNLQGQSITHMAKRFFEYVTNPATYKPSHPLFRKE